MGTTNSSFRPFLSSMAFVLSTLISAYAFPEPTANSTTSHGVNGIAEPSALVSAARHLKSTADDVDLDECFKDLCQSESYLAEIKQRCKDQSDWGWDWACDWLEFHDVYTTHPHVTQYAYEVIQHFDFEEDRVNIEPSKLNLRKECFESSVEGLGPGLGSKIEMEYEETVRKSLSYKFDESFRLTWANEKTVEAGMPKKLGGSLTRNLKVDLKLGRSHSATDLKQKATGTDTTVQIPAGETCVVAEKFQEIGQVTAPFVVTATIKGRYSTATKEFDDGPYAAQCCYLSGLPGWGPSDCGELGSNGLLGFGDDNKEDSDYWFSKMVTAKDLANHDGHCRAALRMQPVGENDAQFQMRGELTGGVGFKSNGKEYHC